MFNQIITGDSAVVLQSFPDNSIDLTVTSPPYDNLRGYNGFSFNFQETAQQLFRATKDGGVLVWVVGDATVNGSETGTSLRQALGLMDVGFRLHDTMIYRKKCVAYPTHTRYYQCFEYMFVFSKGKPKTINLIADRPNNNAGDAIRGNNRRPDGSLHKKSGVASGRRIKEIGVRFNIWEYATGWGHTYTEDWLRSHPAMFPEALAHDHIVSWSQEGDVVLDCFCGAGTTLKAAKSLNRRYIGIDISEEYVALAHRRANGLLSSG